MLQPPQPERVDSFSRFHAFYSAAASLQSPFIHTPEARQALKCSKYSSTQHPKHSKHSKHSKFPKYPPKHPHPLPKTQALWVTHGGPLNAGLYVCLQWQQSEAIRTSWKDYEDYNADIVRLIQQTWNKTCQKGGSSKGAQGGKIGRAHV